MSGRLSLRTSDLGGNERYSFLPTPLEMHAGREVVQRLPLTTGSDTREKQQTTAEYSKPKSSIMYDGVRETQKQKESSIALPYSTCPPPEEHPANYAPYADDVGAQKTDYTTHVPQYTHNAPPNSPGPLPTKARSGVFDEVRSDIPVTVTPDSNPLHSPKPPYSPPPATMTPSQAAAGPADITTYHHPGQISHTNQTRMGGTWSHSLCDCSGIGTCCLGLLCPCILYGRTQHRLAMRSRKEDPTNMLGYETCNGSCVAMAFLCGCQWFMATVQHTRTRRSYGIQGSLATDCVRASCCTCCTLIQDEKEIQEREGKRRTAARGSGIMLAEPYTAPGAMTYPPPPTRAPRT